MSPVPSSLVAAVLVSAAAGKNPWVPIGLLALVAAPAGVPSWVLQPEVQARLHTLAPAPWLWGFAAVMLLLALLESLGDKVPGAEAWLVPLSSAWRPFAAMTLASVLAWAGLAVPSGAVPTMAQVGDGPVLGAQALALGSIGWAVLTVALGTFAGYLASVGKVGARLLLTLVPVPGLKLAHSFADDAFAVIATGVGLVFADSTVVLVVVVVYLLVGLVTGPVLARLTSIYIRVLFSLVRRANPDRAPLALPPWARAEAEAIGADPQRAVLRVYTFKAREVGWARHGYLMFGADELRFVSKALFGKRTLRVPEAQLRRIGLAESATVRAVTVVGRDEEQPWESRFYLFPASGAEVEAGLAACAAHARLVAVSPCSESARRGLPGYGRDDARYRPASVAGDLRLQALTTVVAASIVGVLTFGVYIPIGAGYVFSPFPRRFVISTFLSIYLALSAVGTFGAALLVTVAYGVILNAVALRDLTRHAVQARVDGYVDKATFLPLPDHRVWVPRSAVLGTGDTVVDDALFSDGPWRVVVAALRASVDAPRAI